MPVERMETRFDRAVCGTTGQRPSANGAREEDEPSKAGAPHPGQGRHDHFHVEAEAGEVRGPVALNDVAAMATGSKVGW